MKLKNCLALILPSVSLMLVPSQAFAGAGNIYPPAYSCTTIDCGGVTNTGIYTYSQHISTTDGGPVFGADPYIVQVYSSGNECIRMSVLSQGTDLEAVLVAPDGTVWRDDDGGGSGRPLIKAITTNRGWHTLIIARYDGGVPRNLAGNPGNTGNFTFKYGRYLSTTNPNCASPTTPSFLRTIELPKK